MKSGILEIFACGIQNPGPWNPEYRAEGIQTPTNDWNPESKIHWKRSGIQGLESGNHRVESRIQVRLGFPYMGRQSVQNAAGRVIAFLRKFDRINNTLKELYWLPAVKQRIIFKINLN